MAETAFNPALTSFSIVASCSLDPNSIYVDVNNLAFPNFAATSASVTLTSGLPTGSQVINLGGTDTNGNEVRVLLIVAVKVRETPLHAYLEMKLRSLSAMHILRSVELSTSTWAMGNFASLS